MTPFAQTVRSWYWGHGRLGEYSVVWFDSLTPNGSEFSSVFVSRRAEVPASQCGAVQVRPYGENSTFPLAMSSGNAAGFRFTVQLSKDETLQVDVSAHTTLVSLPPYKRWTGNLQGGIQGSGHLTGVALYEEFVFSPPGTSQHGNVAHAAHM